MRKILLYTIMSLAGLNSYAQQNLVQIISSGEGKTKEQALNTALRHCIEKTFGTFISTNATVVNDSLINDEMVTISSGNIASYQIISEQEEKEKVTTTVSAQVSPERIVKVLNGKGYSFEINGSLYAQNILLEQFYKEQERKAILDFFKTWENVQLFDFEITVGNAWKMSRSNFGFNYKFTSSVPILNSFKDKLSSFEHENKFISHFTGGKDRGSTVGPGLGLTFSMSHNFCEKEESVNFLDYWEAENIYIIPILFIPKANNNFLNFTRSCLNLFKSISIKEPIESYERLNGKPISFFIETPSETDSLNLNTCKQFKFYLRSNLFYESEQYWDGKRITIRDLKDESHSNDEKIKEYIENCSIREKEVINTEKFKMKLTVDNFLDAQLINLKLPPLVLTSDEQNYLFNDREGDGIYRENNAGLFLRNYGAFANGHVHKGFDPSLLFVFLTFDELKNFKKFDFQIKK